MTTNWLNPPKAKPHPKLSALRAQMGGAQVEDVFEIAGTKYTMRTLWPHEETWADRYVDGANFYQTGRARRIPYVAASLQAIDGTSMRELFVLPDDCPAEMREVFEKNHEALETWRRDQVFQRITDVNEPLFSPPVLSQLWISYQELEERRKEALEKIGPLSKRIPNGDSGPTSSPEKGS